MSPLRESYGSQLGNQSNSLSGNQAIESPFPAATIWLESKALELSGDETDYAKIYSAESHFDQFMNLKIRQSTQKLKQQRNF